MHQPTALAGWRTTSERADGGEGDAEELEADERQVAEPERVRGHRYVVDDPERDCTARRRPTVATSPTTANGWASRRIIDRSSRSQSRVGGPIDAWTVPAEVRLTAPMSTSSRRRPAKADGDPLSVEAGPIEAPVDDRLDPPPERLEERGDDQRGQGDRDRVAAGHGAERPAEDDDDPGVGGDQRDRDQRRRRSSG